MSKTIATPPLEAVTDDKGLPKINTDIVGVTAVICWSDYVLVKAKDWPCLKIGRYSHTCSIWQVDGLNGVEVIEWWPLPKEGTGVKVET